jgi:DNA-directed RNA polymerase alpha subunit
MISNEQKMTISLIENMDELKLKQFLFHNLESVDPYLYKLLFSQVDESKLSNRIKNCFLNELGFEIFHYDLILRNDKFFKYIPNFGKKSLKIVKEYLNEYGLKLNTDLKDIKYEALKSLNLINLKHDYLFVEKRGFMK